MRQIRLWLLPLLLFASQALASTVWILPVKGAIGPALSDYLSREIEEAQQNGVDLVILKMDTPGGLDSSMRDIIHAITTSSVPIATWLVHQVLGQPALAPTFCSPATSLRWQKPLI